MRGRASHRGCSAPLSPSNRDLAPRNSSCHRDKARSTRRPRSRSCRPAAEPSVTPSLALIADEPDPPRPAGPDDAVAVRFYRDRGRRAELALRGHPALAEVAIERAIRVEARDQGSLTTRTGDHDFAVP